MAINFGAGDNLLAGYQVRTVAERRRNFCSQIKAVSGENMAFSPLFIVFGKRATPAKNEGRQSAGRRCAACSHNSLAPANGWEPDSNAAFPKRVCWNTGPCRTYLWASHFTLNFAGRFKYILLVRKTKNVEILMDQAIQILNLFEYVKFFT